MGIKPKLISQRIKFSILLFLLKSTAALVLIFSPLLARSDVSFSAAETIRPCDDYATLVLGDPWDMSNKEDVVNFIPLDLTYISDPAFNSGEFSFQTTETNGGTIRFLAPQLPATLPIGGRWGANYPIDTQKYTHFTIRMSTETLDNGYGLALLWNRSQSYGKNNSYTTYVTTAPQRSNYTINLSTISIDSSRSDNLNSWQSASIEGFGILPTVTKQRVTFDYARLEDPSSCGNVTLNYSVSTANPINTANLHNIYLDDDTDPLNGYLKKLVTGGTGVGDKSVLTSSLGLAPGSYNLVGLQSSDYATIVRDDGWDFNSSTDLLAAGGVTSANYNGGKLSGIANDAVLYLRVNPSEKINSAIFNKLTFKISPRTDVVVSFDNGSGLTSVAATKDGSDPDGDGIFQLDLSSNTAWNGQIQTFALSLNYPGGTPFEIDFVKVNNGDFSQNDTPPTTSSQSASLSVSAPPIIHIQQPDIKGGVAFKPWNYRPGDLAFSENLTNSPDPLLTGEPLSTYLPDTRLVGGIRGDFFKGTNVAGNDDPHDFLFFPYFTTTNNYKIDANEYRFFCAKMMIDREFDLGLGSVARLSFIGSDDKTTVTEEWGVISDRWSGNRWYEFCGDLTNFYSESDQGYYWKGEVKSFRLDPHEFHLDTCCTPAGAPFGSPINATYYLDYLKLRKMDESNGRYTLVFKKSDQDSTTTTTRFFYNRTRSTSGGLEIPSSQLNCEGDICIWDTSTIPEGSYWIYGEISDGTLTTSRLSTGQVKIVNTTSTPTTPVLSVESPQENQEVCSALQIKGYSLLSDKFEDISAVQVFIDGIHFRTITPTLYNPTAVNQYPLADSSNAGFDESHDISALNDGNHTIIIKSYSSDGGIKTESRTVVKRSGCMDRAISDPAPAGSPSPITNREDLAPGDGVVLGLEHSLNDLRFLISGTRNCQMIRLGISSKSGGPYQYIYANTDSSAINTSFLTALSENLPRYTASIISTKQLASLNRQIASIKKNSLKKSKVCKAIKNSSKKRACLRGLKSLNNKLTTLRKRVRKSSTHNGIIYYIADCDQGVYSSSEQQFNSKAITCPTGESCKSFTNINQWFNTVISKSRPK